jgi:hypothetical protein
VKKFNAEWGALIIGASVLFIVGLGIRALAQHYYVKEKYPDTVPGEDGR